MIRWPIASDWAKAYRRRDWPNFLSTVAILRVPSTQAGGGGTGSLEQMVELSPAPTVIDVRTLAAFAHCPNAGKILHLRQGEKEETTPDRIANEATAPASTMHAYLNRKKSIACGLCGGWC